MRDEIKRLLDILDGDANYDEKRFAARQLVELLDRSSGVSVDRYDPITLSNSLRGITLEIKEQSELVQDIFGLMAGTSQETTVILCLGIISSANVSVALKPLQSYLLKKSQELSLSVLIDGFICLLRLILECENEAELSQLLNPDIVGLLSKFEKSSNERIINIIRRIQKLLPESLCR